MVGVRGFEPPFSGPKPDVLPLDDTPIFGKSTGHQVFAKNNGYLPRRVTCGIFSSGNTAAGLPDDQQIDVYRGGVKFLGSWLIFT